MRRLTTQVAVVLAIAHLAPFPANAQTPGSEGLARWCESPGRCFNVLNPDPSTVRGFCVRLVQLKQKAINDLARIELHRRERQDAGYETVESLVDDGRNLAEVVARQEVFRRDGNSAHCAPFVPAAPAPVSTP